MRLQLAMLVALTITGCSPGPTESTVPEPPGPTGMRWITMDVDAVETARAALAKRDSEARLDVLEAINGVAVVSFDAQDFPVLSELMHEQHGRCGGFVAHDNLDEALGALRAKDREGIAPLVGYTIDNAATVQALLPKLSTSNILTNIQQLAGGAGFATRYYTSTGGGQSSTWLRDLWRGYAASRPEVTVDLFETGWAQKSVIATIPGTTLANEVVVIGGHLDSIAPGSSATLAPGADDDASGIATISEVFRVLMAQNYRPLRTVKLMAYAAEEVGLLGSKQIVTSYQSAGTNVVGVVQLDMTNYMGSTKDIWLMQDYTNAAQNTFVGNLIDTYVGATWGTDSCGYGCSDHASWHNAGYPASMPFESRMSQYNPNIHTTGDTLSVSSNTATHALKFAKLGAAFIAELAKGQIGTSGNTPPTVSISAPANGSSFPQGTAVTLTGTASDAQDGSLSASIRWTSNLDGSLGSGASRSVTLSVGTHTIQAAVTDAGGLTATASISVTITGTATELFRESFEGTTSWSPTGLWHNANNSTCASPGYSSATHAMYFGIDSQCNYSNGTTATGTITSPIITGVVSTSSLRFQYFRQVESASGSYDVASVEVVSGTTSSTVWTRSSANASNTVWNDSGAISLSAFAGKSIQIRFRFDSKDSAYNTYKGWLVDDIVVTR
ncbi:MAG TPA: M20/M25/M40 family metallo-hydrolase [Kofleriaceae bacterium]|nr:M20/M25/M40 family metallo-hydrolase [Kofleriaceae bacterium]